MEVNPTMSKQFISIIVPALNEEKYIKGCLQSLIESADDFEFEILVMDGGSTDDTAGIVRAMAVETPAVRLCGNPGRLQSAGMNLGAKIASPRAGIIVRADAHAAYPPDFVSKCLAAFLAHDAASVVVPMVNKGVTGIQRAIAKAQSSRLGNGGSAHRTGGVSGFVEHGHHAMFNREVFLRLGGYDTRFTHNEDAEYDVRLRRAGGKIWMCGDAAVTYFPRKSLTALSRQYFKHGQGRARNLVLHRIRPKLRQLAPVGMLFLCLAGVLLAPLSPWFLLGPALYLVMCLAWGIKNSLSARDPWLLASGAAVVTMHLSWAVGFLACIAGELAGKGRSKAARSGPGLDPAE